MPLLKHPHLILKFEEIGPFILCFINMLSLKQMLGTIFIHRIFYILSKRFKIENFELDFKIRGHLGVYSKKLEEYLDSLKTRFWLVKRSNVHHNSPKLTTSYYFVNNNGIKYYQKHLTRYKRERIKDFAKFIDKYNEMSPEELYKFYKQLEHVNKFFSLITMLIHYVMRKVDYFHYYQRFKDIIRNEEKKRQIFGLDKI